MLRLQRAAGNAAAGAVVVQRATFKIEVREDGKPGGVVRPVKAPKGGAVATGGPSAVPASLPAQPGKLSYALPPGETAVPLRDILHDFLSGDPWLNGPFPIRSPRSSTSR
ncbi:hypothetical protein Q5530_28250 [Saccharothrix sp. BKS2]|uniref:hypothetical protein n=1 Tax=Saccharothrix sp. BKS2 TaxID=3064400 RepID=UPI0039E85819